MWSGSVGLGQIIACVGGGLLIAYSFQKSGLDRKIQQDLNTNR